MLTSCAFHEKERELQCNRNPCLFSKSLIAAAWGDSVKVHPNNFFGKVIFKSFFFFFLSFYVIKYHTDNLNPVHLPNLYSRDVTDSSGLVVTLANLQPDPWPHSHPNSPCTPSLRHSPLTCKLYPDHTQAYTSGSYVPSVTQSSSGTPPCDEAGG